VDGMGEDGLRGDEVGLGMDWRRGGVEGAIVTAASRCDS
jgi:hypothetical protein